MGIANKNWTALFKKDQAQEKPSLTDQKSDKQLVEEKLNELRSKLKDPQFAKKVADLLSGWK